jgi:cysteine desulfurase
MRFKGKNVYCDYAATTLIDPAIRKTMKKSQSQYFYNPGGLYQAAIDAKQQRELARASIATSMAALPDEVLFVHTATEANILAMTGVIAAAQTSGIAKPHVITNVIEHASVRDTVRRLADQGSIEVTELPITTEGIVDVTGLPDQIRPETVLISVMLANNELGTIQPIADIAKAIRKHRTAHSTSWPLLHSDASQAFLYQDCNIHRLHVDLMTISSHKMYGPKGIAALFAKRGLELAPDWLAGEFTDTSLGTQDVVAIIGFAEACQIAVARRKSDSTMVQAIRDRLVRDITQQLPEITINGSLESRLPNNLHLSIPGLESELAVIELAERGIACSTRSACKQTGSEPSYVMQALSTARRDNDPGFAETEPTAHVRLSLGRFSKPADAGKILKAIQSVFTKYQV